MKPNPETSDTWRAGYDEIRLDQHLAFARLSPNDKLKAMEELLETFKDRMPKHEFLDSW
jgi:hypothetical protein